MLNLGTPSSERVEAMLLAGRRANGLSKPVVFDPVGISASPFRENAVRRFLSELRITVFRGNRAEIGALAGVGGELRGVDAVKGPSDLRGTAEELSKRTGAIVVVSGEHDLVAGTGKIAVVKNGHPLMGRVTGMGCMLTAVIAAFVAVEEDLMVAAIAAVACFGVAGEYAGKQAAGPGTFKAALLDALSIITSKELQAAVRLEG